MIWICLWAGSTFCLRLSDWLTHNIQTHTLLKVLNPRWRRGTLQADVVRSDWLSEEVCDWWSVSYSNTVRRSALVLSVCTRSLCLHFVCFLFSLHLCFNDWALSPLKTPPTPESDSASFYSVNRGVVYCGQLRRPQCFNAVLHDHQSHRQQLRPHSVSLHFNIIRKLNVYILDLFDLK